MSDASDIWDSLNIQQQGCLVRTLDNANFRYMGDAWVGLQLREANLLYTIHPKTFLTDLGLEVAQYGKKAGRK